MLCFRRRIIHTNLKAMIKQKVFIPVEGTQDYDVAFFGIKDSKELKGKAKEQEGYFFTPLQFVELLTSVFDAGLKYDGTSDFIDNYIQSLNIK